MNRGAIVGLLVAILIPVVAYFVLKNYTDRDTAMPRHYGPDSLVSRIEKGKRVEDTIWHKVQDFKLLNQLGDTVSWDKLEGKVIVANFFFTHCPTICPTLTAIMKDMQNGIKSPDKIEEKNAEFVQFLSFSIDPERDSVAALKNWANRFNIDPGNWYLLTGPKKTIYDLSNKDMKLIAVDGQNVDSSFIHTDMFVLLDKQHVVRGYYHMLTEDKTPDTIAMKRLSRDLVMLAVEKDRSQPTVFSGQLVLIASIFAITALLIGGLVFYLKRTEPRS